MKPLGKIAMMVIALLVLTGAARTDPRNQIIPIPTGNVALHMEPDTTLGRYYTVSYQLPAGLQSDQVDRAVLELYVTVRAKARGEYVNAAPVLEVYALKTAYAGALNEEDLDQASRAVRPVALGENRRVLLDITGIVRAQLSGELSNHGLVLGSVTDMREGDFTLVSERLPGGAVAQIRLYRRTVE